MLQYYSKVYIFSIDSDFDVFKKKKKKKVRWTVQKKKWNI